METQTQTHAKFISTEICSYGAVTSVNQKQKCLQLTPRTEQMFLTHRGTAHAGITWRGDTIPDQAKVPHTLLLLLSSYNH